MRAAHHDHCPHSPEPQGDVITMACRGRIYSDGDQIKLLTVRNGLVILVDKGDIISGFINKARQIWHGDLSKVIKLAFAVFVNLRAFGCDEKDTLFYVRDFNWQEDPGDIFISQYISASA